MSKSCAGCFFNVVGYCLVLLLLVFAPFQSFTQNLCGEIEWKIVHYEPLKPFSFPTGLDDIAFGNGTFVAVGDKILVSTNGAEWRTLGEDPPVTLHNVVYGGGRFVAVGGAWVRSPQSSSSVIYMSEDGFHWSKVLHRTIQSVHASEAGDRTLFLSDVVYGNGRFLAVGTGAGKMVLSSTNGIDWEEIETDVLRYANSLTFANEMFVAVGSGIMTSRDGLSWQRQAQSDPVHFWGITYGGGYFSMVRLDGAIFSSPTTAEWSLVGQIGTHTNLHQVGTGEGFVVVSGNPILLVGCRNSEWQTVNIPPLPDGQLPDLGGMIFMNGQFFVVGMMNLILRGTIVTSPRLGDVRVSTEGTVEFPLYRRSDRLYRIEASNNLRDWSVVSNVTSQLPLVNIVFPRAPETNAMFYRAVTESVSF